MEDESHHFLLIYLLENTDRCSICTDLAPKYLTCLQKFPAGLIKSISKDSLSSTIEKFACNVREVFNSVLNHLREYLTEIRNEACSARDKIDLEACPLQDELMALSISSKPFFEIIKLMQAGYFHLSVVQFFGKYRHDFFIAMYQKSSLRIACFLMPSQ
jgi:hypothetical protein